MSQEQTEAPALPSTVATGNESLDARIAAAAGVLVTEEDEAPSTEAEEPTVDAPEAEAAPEADEKPKAKAKDEPKPEKTKPRNMMRDLAAEWATARRAQQANAKKAQELEARAAELEAQTAQAREVAMLMQGHPSKAVERLAALAGISQGEFLQRLQMEAMNADAERQAKPQSDAVLQELARLREELHAEKRARAEAEHRQQYEAQLAQIHQAETQNLVGMAQTYTEEFPALANLPPKALERQISDAVAWHLAQGREASRFEVLQAVNTVVTEELERFGVNDMLSARAASAPAASRAGKSMATAAPSRPRNGAGRYIPSNAAAADSGAPRRPMTVEERLREAEKVLWAKG